ncbi:MAG: SDR family NAD(P)-dependent oxidoreductase [Bdellovibrionales bacterium]|nr:SDR family NAD(P)-dependent oxidoreductase [Bdellovibrionales bacterium]
MDQAKTKVAIITGASKGLGAGIAKALLHEGYQVYGLSRSEAQESSKHFLSISIDLRSPEDVQQKASDIFRKILAQEPTEVLLINNAGSADPYGCFGDLNFSLAQSVLNTNLISAMVFMNEFIRTFQDLAMRKTIINVSSQSAETPSEGGSVYCAAKSALEMLTKTIAIEQSQKQYPITTIAFRPGLMDTELQALARDLPVAKFPAALRFKDNYENGRLADPKEVATKFVTNLIFEKPKSGAIYDIKDFRGISHYTRVPFCM